VVMGPAATQQKSKTFSPSNGRMLYPHSWAYLSSPCTAIRSLSRWERELRHCPVCS